VKCVFDGVELTSNLKFLPLSNALHGRWTLLSILFQEIDQEMILCLNLNDVNMIRIKISTNLICLIINTTN